MKRGTPDHPKLADLAARLDIPEAYAGGMIEFMWHWAAKYAIRGDVGKYSNAAIAKGAGWRGDADQFIKALVEARWLDQVEDPQIRLGIHDIHDHADNTLRELLTDKELTFWNGMPPRNEKPGRPTKKVEKELKKQELKTPATRVKNSSQTPAKLHSLSLSEAEAESHSQSLPSAPPATPADPASVGDAQASTPPVAPRPLALARPGKVSPDSSVSVSAQTGLSRHRGVAAGQWMLALGKLSHGQSEQQKKSDRTVAEDWFDRLWPKAGNPSEFAPNVERGLELAREAAAEAALTKDRPMKILTDKIDREFFGKPSKYAEKVAADTG